LRPPASADTHYQLAEVAPLEQANERRRGLLQPVNPILAEFHPTGGDPFAHVAPEGVKAVGIVVEDDEALQANATASTSNSEPVGPGGSVSSLFGDHSAHRHARANVEQGEHGVEHRAANAFKIDVDAVRTGGSEPLDQLRLAVVETDVEAERTTA
jgi:hypothetical protein